MEFSKSQLKFIQEFVDEINNGDAAIFAGAGLSAPAGFVNWKELLKDLADELDLDIEKEHDLISLAQYHFNKFARGKINNKIINEFTSLTSGTENHRILSSVGIETFWTTNYDQLIEKTLEGTGKRVDRKVKNADFSRNIKKRNAVVYKMHGDKDSPNEAILIKDDYESYNDKNEFFSTALRGDLLSKTFLFIGFSFDDPNLDHILSRIRVLLKENTPTHYCFLREISQNDFDNPEDFTYAKIKQQLKVQDLGRYGIHAIMIKEYSDITDILKEIEKRVKLKNILISGAAHEYEPYTEGEAKELLHTLSYKLAEKEYKIISGYGIGVGSIVINGALEYKLKSNYRSLDDVLILRSFPQVASGAKELTEIWTNYRKEMISNAGIAIFLFGNKKLENGDIALSDGMLEEFNICLEQKVIPIPVGATGYIAEQLWEKIKGDIDFLPNNPELRDAFFAIGEKGISNEKIISNVLKIIGILQKS